MHAIFAEHMIEPQAAMAFAEAAEIAERRPAALLCYEQDAACCHRRILTDRLRAERGFTCTDLEASP